MRTGNIPSGVKRLERSDHSSSPSEKDLHDTQGRETVKYSYESRGTRNQEWLCWRGPAKIRPVRNDATPFPSTSLCSCAWLSAGTHLLLWQIILDKSLIINVIDTNSCIGRIFPLALFPFHFRLIKPTYIVAGGCRTCRAGRREHVWSSATSRANTWSSG
jgi:hypothetical protein